MSKYDRFVMRGTIRKAARINTRPNKNDLRSEVKNVQLTLQLTHKGSTADQS